MKWPFRISKPSTRNAEDLTIEMLRTFIPRCYACGSDISGHEYSEFASCVVHDKSDELAHWFFKLFLEERWTDLRRERSFEGSKDAAIVYAVLCPAGGQMLAVRSPVELWENNSRLQVQQVTKKAASEIRELSNDWRVIPGKTATQSRGH